MFWKNARIQVTFLYTDVQGINFSLKWYYEIQLHGNGESTVIDYSQDFMMAT